MKKVAIIAILIALSSAVHADGIGGGIGGSNGIGNGVGDPNGIAATTINLTPTPPSTCTGALDLSQGCIIPGLG